MTATITYPSTQFPAPAGVSLECPDGWEPLTVTEALIALGRAGSPEGEFQPNVVVTTKRTIGATLDEAATATVQALESTPGWEETGREMREAFGGRRSFRIEGAFTHPQAGTLYQSALITVVEQGPFADVVQAVGTCSGSQVKEYLPDIRKALQSASVAD